MGSHQRWHHAKVVVAIWQWLAGDGGSDWWRCSGAIVVGAVVVGVIVVIEMPAKGCGGCCRRLAVMRDVIDDAGGDK